MSWNRRTDLLEDLGIGTKDVTTRCFFCAKVHVGDRDEGIKWFKQHTKSCRAKKMARKK